VVDYLRGFCTNKSWPRGELNLPRAFATEKAFPESETVVSTAIDTQGAGGVITDIVYERRLSVRNQMEVDVPVQFAKQESGAWFGGVGDITLGLKRVLFSSYRTGSIFSLQGSLILPTGNKERGFGTGVTTFETFASFGQILPRNSFVQLQAGSELPTHPDNSPQSVYWRAAVGKSFRQERGLGRLWTPMMEFVAARDLVTGAKTNWDVLPEFQVTINRRQHVRFNTGLRIPATNTVGRPIQVVLYVLWDWFDGGLLEGWK
jgi:hypothetical protein